MNSIEDRLRDAIRDATEAVSPAVLPGLEKRIAQHASPARLRTPRRSRLTASIAAAAAVTGIAVLAAMLATQVPARRADRNGPGPAAAGEPRFVIADSGISTLFVRRTDTGAIVARIRMPANPSSQTPSRPSPERRTYISDVATGNGRDFLVAIYRPDPCRSWLYKFALNGQGQPTALTPFAARPTIAGVSLIEMAISGNGRKLAFMTVSSGPTCSAKKTGPSHIGVMNMATGRIRQWSVPQQSSVDSVSITADGGLLLYSLQFSPSVVRAIPVSAPPGNAGIHGRTIVRAAQFGRSEWISFAAITPDGRAVYFSTYPPGGGGPGQIRVISLAGGRARVIARDAEYPGLIAADPGVRHLLLHIHKKISMLDLGTDRVIPLRFQWNGFVGALSW